jgi:lactoylglutathione lyase
MKLAKAQIDFGLCTNNIDPLLSFWQTDVGLQLDHVLPVRRGQTQHRHDALGSVIKINHIVKGLPQTTPSGYRELLIARPNLAHPQRLTDPDGNRVTLLPRGNEGVNQIGIRLTVRNLDAHRAFYTNVLELEEQPTFDGAAFRAGETRLILKEQPDAPLKAHAGAWLALHHLSGFQCRRSSRQGSRCGRSRGLGAGHARKDCTYFNDT